MSGQAPVPVEVAGLYVEQGVKSPLLLLKVVDAAEYLPLRIGVLDATAIACAIKGMRFDRPLTHDLLHSALTALNASPQHVEINGLEEGTFFASITLRAGERALELDSRPSDAIALALRAGVEIRVSRGVLDQAGVRHDSRDGKEPEVPGSDASPEKLKEFLEGLERRDFGEYEM